jgi:DNA-binding MarR family transcriptional regulator
MNPEVGHPPLDDRGTCLIGETLDQAMDLTARYLSDRAGLSASAGFLLNRVSREGPARLTALATKEGVSQPSMTQLIQRLERQGLVTRLADPDDGRVALVTITQAGQELLDDRMRARRERLAMLLATLSSEDAFALWLSAHVAQPILRCLGKNADLLAAEDGCQTSPREPSSITPLTPRASAPDSVLGVGSRYQPGGS